MLLALNYFVLLSPPNTVGSFGRLLFRLLTGNDAFL